MTKYDIPTPEKGALVQITDDVYWARFDLPFRLNHINLYILDAGDSWVLIDTGLDDDDTAATWTLLLEGPLKGKPVSKLIATHHHVDHIGYAGGLVARTRAQPYASQGELEVAQWLKTMDGDIFANSLASRYRSFGLGDDDVAIGQGDKDRYRKNVQDLPDFLTLNSGDVITSANGSWDVRIDAGHSPAQISLHDKKRNIYIAVDFLLPRISPNVSASMYKPEHDYLGDYLTYLNDIGNTLNDETLVLPGHDWPFTEGPKRAEELIEHHHHRLDQLMARAEEGPLTVADGMTVLFNRVFGAHELFFATGEAAAHLIHLQSQGRLRLEDHDGVMIYHKV